jgi:hypothetical protein
VPFVTNGSRRTSRVLAAAAGLALAGFAPAAAQAKPDKSDAQACVVDHVLTNPFAAWGDHADYALAPGGDFETGATGWTLDDGAAVTTGNQPFDIGAPGASSLELPLGASAVSPAMCIDETYTSFRFFARNDGSRRSALRVQVRYLDRQGRSRDETTRLVAGDEWSLTESLELDGAEGAELVEFRFTPRGRGDWQIDDLYVDPYARR